MALVESDIARLEKQLANRKAEAMEMATAFETTGNNLQESADSQWEEIHKSLYTELEELARDPPTPCPGHVAYLKQVGRPVSFMDKRTWVDLVGQLHCVSDHYLYHCESVDMDIIDGNDINNNIDIYINKMINTCAGEEDNNPNNNNNLDGSGAGTSGGTGGSTGGGNPSSTPLHVNGGNINNDNNEISLCPLGYTPGSNIVSSQVKCMVLCTVNNDNYILFIKNNLGNYVWASGESKPEDADVKNTASRLVNSLASLHVEACEWSCLGVDMDIGTEGRHIMKSHITVASLPVLKSTRDDKSMKAVWVPLMPALSLIRQPSIFMFEYVGVIIFEYLSEAYPIEWNTPLMGTSAIQYLSGGHHMSSTAANQTPVGTPPTEGRFQTPNINNTNDGTNRQLFNTNNLRAPVSIAANNETDDRVITNNSDRQAHVKLVTSLIMCKITVEKNPQILLTQCSDGKWGLPHGTIDTLDDSVAKSATRVVKDQTGLQVETDKWIAIGYDHITVDNSIASLLYKLSTVNLPKVKSQSDNFSVEARWIPLQAFLDLLRIPDLFDKSKIPNAVIGYLSKTFPTESVKTPDVLGATAQLMPKGTIKTNTEQQNTTPVFNNGAGKLIPLPAKWNTTKLASLPKPKFWLKVVDDYMAAANWNYPTHFVLFLEGDVLEWWYTLKEAREAAQLPLDKEYIVKCFLERFTSHLLKESTEALHKLMNGTISMASSKDFHDYETSFRNCVRECGSLTEDSQIQYFLKGLPDTLRSQCIHHPLTNKEFSCFEDLVAHAKAKYAVMSMFSSSGTPSVAYVSADTPQNPFPRHPRPPKQPLTRLESYTREQELKNGWKKAKSAAKRRAEAPPEAPDGGRGRGRGRDAGRGRGSPRDPPPPPPPRDEHYGGRGRGRDAGRGRGGYGGRGRGAPQPELHFIQVQGKRAPEPEEIPQIAAACQGISVMYNPAALWKETANADPTPIPEAHQMKMRVDKRCVMCKQIGCADRRGDSNVLLCQRSVVLTKAQCPITQAANWAIRGLPRTHQSGYTWDWAPELKPYLD
jgi:ADP-ribose pyrophosphatase YjhB (NUDIX family)